MLPNLPSHQWKSNGSGIYWRLSNCIGDPVKKLAHAKSDKPVATILSIPKFQGCKWMQHARTCKTMAFDGIWWHLASSKGSNINLPPWPPLANHVGPVSPQHSPSSIWKPVGQSGSKIGIWLNHYNHMKSAHQMQSFQNWHVLFLGPRWLLRRKVSPEATWLEARRKVPMYGKSWHKLKLASTITNLCLPSLAALKLMQQPHLRMSEVQNIAQQTSTSVKNSLSLHRLLKEFSRAKGE